MALAVLPAILTLRLDRWPAAIAVGALIWIAGGVAPLLVPNDFMGTAQRIIHMVEILTQNASLGITSVLLLRPRSQFGSERSNAAARPSATASPDSVGTSHRPPSASVRTTMRPSSTRRATRA
jgi:hypothetical protein